MLIKIVNFGKKSTICMFSSAKEVLFSSAFVCVFVSRITQKLLNRFSQNSGEKVAHFPRKKLLDFGGNPNHKLGLG